MTSKNMKTTQNENTWKEFDFESFTTNYWNKMSIKPNLPDKHQHNIMQSHVKHI